MTATAAPEAPVSDPIREVRCYDCTVPLPRPLIVGQATVTKRTYALVRIRTASGLEGAAYAFGRGLPVATIIEESLAPLLLGADPGHPGADPRQARRGLLAIRRSRTVQRRGECRRPRALGPARPAPGRPAGRHPRPLQEHGSGVRRRRIQARGSGRARSAAGGDVQLRRHGLPCREAHGRSR